MKYTYRVCLLSGQIVETSIDLSKVVAIEKAGGSQHAHRVFCTGLRAPIELLDLPPVMATTGEIFDVGRKNNFEALFKAWEHEGAGG